MQTGKRLRSAMVSLGVLLAACTPAEEQTPDAGTGGTVIGRSSVDIDTRVVTTHVGEAPIGNLMADVLRSEMAARGTPVDLALVNAGSIRGGGLDLATFKFVSEEARIGKVYPAGPITDADVDGWHPFRNDTSLLTLTGTQLKSVLERSAAALPPDLKMQEGGWFLQVSGLSYVIDCAGARQKLTASKDAVEVEGSRVVRIQVGGAVLYDVTGASPVDALADARVKVAVNNFIASGLDGHLAFKTAQVDRSIPIAEFDFTAQLKKHVAEHSPIAPVTEGRITVLGQCGQPLSQP